MGILVNGLLALVLPPLTSFGVQIPRRRARRDSLTLPQKRGHKVFFSHSYHCLVRTVEKKLTRYYPPPLLLPKALPLPSFSPSDLRTNRQTVKPEGTFELEKIENGDGEEEDGIFLLHHSFQSSLPISSSSPRPPRANLWWTRSEDCLPMGMYR